jgi:hypothetical protein
MASVAMPVSSVTISASPASTSAAESAISISPYEMFI